MINEQIMNKQMSAHAGMAAACQDYRAKKKTDGGAIGLLRGV